MRVNEQALIEWSKAAAERFIANTEIDQLFNDGKCGTDEYGEAVQRFRDALQREEELAKKVWME